MQVYCFHLMPWAYLPEDFFQSYKSAWVTCPNTFYDPELGHPLYNRYLDELELADSLASMAFVSTNTIKPPTAGCRRQTSWQPVWRGEQNRRSW